MKVKLMAFFISGTFGGLDVGPEKDRGMNKTKLNDERKGGRWDSLKKKI
jgi:hypothetical protein